MANLQPLNVPNRRKADRRCALDDYLCLVDLSGNRTAMLLDVSETGIGVQSVEGVGEGFSTTFRFQLPDTAVLVEGEGEIAWVDRAGRMGVRFTKIADDVKPELRNWVASEANPLFAHEPVSEAIADLDARDRVAQLEARIIVSGWAQLQALNFLVDQIAAMTQASGVAIALEDGSGMVCKASSGIAPEAGARVNPRSGLSWECVRTKEVVTCVDTENDPRVDRLVCRELNMRSAMLVPVKKDDRVAGLVEVFSGRPHAFTNQTVILLRRVAEAVASLDETAPEASVLEMPAAKAELQPVAPVAPQQSPRQSRDDKKAAIAQPTAETEPVPPPIPAPVLAAKEPVSAPPTHKPSVGPAVAPAAAAAAPALARTAPVLAPAPATTKIGGPFAQEVAAASAIAAPAPEKPIEKPLVVAEPAAPVVSTAAPRPVEVKPVENPEPVAKVVEKHSEPASATMKPATSVAGEGKNSPPQPKPVVTTDVPARAKTRVREEVVEPPVATQVAVRNAPEVAPPPARVPQQNASLPAAASSGAAGTVKVSTTSPAVARVAPEETPTRPTVEQINEIWNATVTADAPSGARKKYIGIAAVVVISISAVGGWYWAHVTPQGAAVAQPVNAKTASVPTPVPPAATALLPVASATASSAPNQPAASLKQPPTTPAPAISKTASQTEPADTTKVSTPPAVEPLAVRTSVPTPAEMSPQAPPIAVAPPNTAGVTSVLADPVAAPTLARPTVSLGVTGGRQIAKIQPIYPTTARALHLSGVVTMIAHISTNGTVSEVKVVRGHPLLNAAAIDAVKRWKYEPFMLNGQAIENDVNVQVKFDMPR